jgi:hypothetical protein
MRAREAVIWVIQTQINLFPFLCFNMEFILYLVLSTQSTQGEGVKQWQNSVHVVVECP